MISSWLQSVAIFMELYDQCEEESICANESIKWKEAELRYISISKPEYLKDNTSITTPTANCVMIFFSLQSFGKRQEVQVDRAASSLKEN